jgi:hypothetical protein
MPALYSHCGEATAAVMREIPVWIDYIQKWNTIPIHDLVN